MKSRDALKTSLIAGIERWKDTIDNTFAAIQEAMEKEDWAAAQELMQGITQQQAQVSLNMRNAFIRYDLIPEEDE